MTTKPKAMSRTITMHSLVWHAASLTAALLFIVPLVWVVSASLRTTGLPPSPTIEWIPRPLAWVNYQSIFELLPLSSYLLNSLIVVALAVPITLTTASWAGFAMAQLQAHLQRKLMMFAVVLLMVPITALWLTRYVVFNTLGLVDTLWALVAPAFMGSNPFFVLLFYWTFRRVPQDLWSSARLDGAGVLRIWATIAMPLARPTTIVVGVLTFMLYWSDFINPLLYLKSERNYTVAIGLQLLQQMDRTNWPLLMAASIVMILPIVVLFLTVQRYFWPESRLSGIVGN